METINTLFEMYKNGCMVIVTVFIFGKLFFDKWINIEFKNPFDK